MPYQISVAVRANQAAQIQSTIGAGATLVIYSGAQPANCGAPSPSGALLTMALPSVFLSSSGGVASMIGTWSGVASVAGIGASWRILDASGICHAQGDLVSNLVLSLTSFLVGQTVTVLSYVHTVGNA